MSYKYHIDLIKNRFCTRIKDKHCVMLYNLIVRF